MKALDPKTLRQHETDFSVLATPSELEIAYPKLRAVRLGAGLSRVRATAESRDELMDKVRSDGLVAHHVYVHPAAPQSAVILTDTVELRPSTGTDVEALLKQEGLEEVGRLGESIVARVTPDARANPLKVAERLVKAGHDAEVRTATVLKAHDVGRSWHVYPAETEPNTGATQAWAVTRGDPEVVIAVIDDGFDLWHPCFENVRVSPHRWNFADGNSNVLPLQTYGTREGGRVPGDYHGTAVASLIFGHEHCRAPGIAPRCTFLPIKVPVGQHIDQMILLAAFQLASEHAHIVCCSLGHDPSPLEYAGVTEETVNQLRKLTATGGLDSRGLTIVCSAGNDGVPVRLDPSQNRYGIEFKGENGIVRIEANHAIYTSFPTIPGIISVGAVTSAGTRAAYSNIGPISLAAPSNNGHELRAHRARYDRAYRGRNLIAAQNRPGVGEHISGGLPGVDGTSLDPLYTEFGGTSGAAPLVAGAIGLMKSVRRDLTPSMALNVLQDSCFVDLAVDDPDFNDPNLQDNNGTFSEQRSQWYGSGLLQFAAAVASVRH